MATNVETMVKEFIERTGGVGGGTIMTGEDVKDWMEEAIKRNSNGDGPTDRETIYKQFRETLDRIGIDLEATEIFGQAPKDPFRYALGLEYGDTPKSPPHKMSIEGFMADIQKAVERHDARAKSPQELLMETLRGVQDQAKMELFKRMDRQAKMLDELLTLCEENGMKLTPKAGVKQQFEEWVKFLRERLSQKSPLPSASVAGGDPSLGEEESGKAVVYLANLLGTPLNITAVVDAVRSMKEENRLLSKARQVIREILTEFAEGLQKMQKRYESEVG